MICKWMGVLTTSELKEVLGLNSSEFDFLMVKGCPCVDIRGHKVFVVESLLNFLKGIQGGNHD